MLPLAVQSRRLYETGTGIILHIRVALRYVADTI